MPSGDPSRRPPRPHVRAIAAARARLGESVRGGRVPGLRTAKTVLAAVAAYALADALHTSSSPVLAPLTALLVVQLTMYETVTIGRERLVSVVAGVLLAVGVAQLTGLTWWSLGLVVGLSLVAGRLLRLGPHLAEVPISAMLVLAVGGSETVAWGRVVETLVGAAVGVAVALLVAPPVYVQPAGDALADLAVRMARYADDLAVAVRARWSRSAAADQLTRARELGEEVARADRALALAEEAARLNPRGRGTRATSPGLRHTLTALEHGQVVLRQLARALLDRTHFVPEGEAADAWRPDARAALAGVLEAAAAVLRQIATDAAASGRRTPTRRDHGPRRHGPPDTEQGDGPARAPEELARLAGHRDRLADRLFVDPHADPAAWAQHGALLDSVDRLRVELATAVSPPEPAWPPARTTARKREPARRLPAVPAGDERVSGARGPAGRIRARLGRRAASD